MRTLSAAIVEALAALMSSCESARTERHSFRFVDLRAGDVVEVHRAAISSMFFHSECAVRIRGGNPPTIRARGIFDPGLREPAELEREDLEGLDEALAYYRARPPSAEADGSVELDITWLRDGVLAFRESLISDPRDDSRLSPDKDFDGIAMESGVPVNRIEFIDDIPSECGHPASE